MLLFKVNFIIWFLYFSFMLALHIYAKVKPWDYTLKMLSNKIYWWQYVVVIWTFLVFFTVGYNIIYFIFFIIL